MAIKYEQDSSGSITDEDSEFNKILEQVQSHIITPKQGIEQAEKIKYSRQDYH